MSAVIQNPDGRQLEPREIGAMPLVNYFIERLKLKEFLMKHVPIWDKRQKVPPAVSLLLLVRNFLTSRLPLFKIPEWAICFDTELLGLPGDPAKYLNDDRVGKSLDAIFRADVETLMTEVVTHAVEEFDIDMRRVHVDPTTISLHGQYPDATGDPRFGRETHRITYGHHKKDGRDDMKQLQYILSTAADGFIPIWVSIDHGNAAEIKSHIRNWTNIYKLLGHPNFLYVGDSKVCSDENLSYIDQHKGRFLTVMPATWSEHKEFHERLRKEVIPWQHVVTIKVKRDEDGAGSEINGDAPAVDPTDDGKDEIKDVYVGYLPAENTPQGFRVMWFLSSRKSADDRAARERRIARAQDELVELREKLGKPYSRLTTATLVTEAVQKILSKRQVEGLFKIEVLTTQVEHHKKIGPGRKGPNSTYRIEKEAKLTLQWQVDALALMEEAKSDGVFPLLTNDKKMSMQQALESYKEQPRLEKRFEQLKTVFNLRPVFLQNHMRIEALLIIYFLVLLVESLIERETRNRMAELRIKDLPIYAEGKKSKAPTAGCIFELFERVRRYRILDTKGDVVEKYYDRLSETQRTVLNLLGIAEKKYLTAGEKGA
jgi:transposase